MGARKVQGIVSNINMALFHQFFADLPGMSTFQPFVLIRQPHL
jgi:hypothetical protein